MAAMSARRSVFTCASGELLVRVEYLLQQLAVGPVDRFDIPRRLSAFS